MGEAVSWIFSKDTLTVERQLQIVAVLCISDTCMNYLELLDPSKILIRSCYFEPAMSPFCLVTGIGVVDFTCNLRYGTLCTMYGFPFAFYEYTVGLCVLAFLPIFHVVLFDYTHIDSFSMLGFARLRYHLFFYSFRTCRQTHTQTVSHSTV